MKVRHIGHEVLVERGSIDPDEWTKIKRRAALEIVRGIKSRYDKVDEDPQVGFDFKRDWRTAPLPVGTVFGSDFDYWNYVVGDAFAMWRMYARQIHRDFIAERIAGWTEEYKDPKTGKTHKRATGASVPFYAEELAVWQNDASVTPNTPLTGPKITIGPTADFAAFLEDWDYSKSTKIGSNGPVKLFQNAGVMNFITRQLQNKYRSVHTITMVPVKNPKESKIRPIDNRKKPVEIVPVILVLPRHYRKVFGK